MRIFSAKRCQKTMATMKKKELWHVVKAFEVRHEFVGGPIFFVKPLMHNPPKMVRHNLKILQQDF